MVFCFQHETIDEVCKVTDYKYGTQSSESCKIDMYGVSAAS